MVGEKVVKRKTQVKVPVACEVLESRLCLSGIYLFGDLLIVQGTNGNDDIQVVENTNTNFTRVSVNDQFKVVDNRVVTTLIVSGGNGDDVIQNRTSYTSVISGGNGNDTIRGGTGDDIMYGGNGNDIINDIGGNNFLSGGNGNDTLQSVSSGQDRFNGGNGNDSLYAIVGGPNVVLGGNGNDSFIVRQGVEVTDAKANERVVAFGADDPGTLRDGILYVGLGTGGNISISQQGKTVVANINGQVFEYDAKDVQAIAGVGSAGDDVFINNTNIDSVYYGANGNDVLIGGGGNDLLKGGNGNDLLVGNGGDDDMAGDGGADFIDAGVLSNPQGKDKVRFDLLDMIFADKNDLLILQ